MARAKRHTLLWLAGAGVGGLAAYEFVYKPWAAARAAAALAATSTGSLLTSSGGSGLTSSLPNVTSMLSIPTPIGTTSLGPQYSGPIGACIAAKGGTWTPAQCETRLNALIASATLAKQTIANLKAGTSNPAASGIPAAQLQLAQEQAALANAQTQLAATTAAGDTNGASIWHAAIAAHQQDISDLTARIAAAQAPVDNSAAIAAYEGTLAANDNDYFALTGQHLLSSI